MPLHADLTTPCQCGVAGELSSFVANNRAGLAMLRDLPGQLPYNILPLNGGIGHARRSLIPWHAWR